MTSTPSDKSTHREENPGSRHKLESSYHSKTTQVQQLSHTEWHSSYHPHRGFHTDSGTRTVASGQALTYARLVEHDRHQARIHAAPGLHLQYEAVRNARVTAAGRSLGFDLSQPIYQKNMRGYETMTPPERVLAGNDKAERARLAWEASGGRRRQ